MGDVTMSTVSIILAPHNGMDHTPACIESIQAQTYTATEIIVVDNASTDGTSRFLKQHYPSVTVVESDQNLAYAGGNNLGASRARGSYLLFLNHDTIVLQGFLEKLVRVMQSHPEIAIAQSRIMTALEPDRIDSIGAYLTRSGMWVHPMRGQFFEHVPAESVEVLGACGACLMVRREVFFELGGFDPDFMIYFEDADLSLRARLLGHRVVVVPSSVILHWGGVTTGQLPSAFTVFHSFKNRLCLLIKDLDFIDLVWSLPIHVALCFLGMVAYLLRLKLKSAAAVASALLWNAMNLGMTIQKRKIVQARKVAIPAEGYEALIKPLPLSYFIRASWSYLARW